MYFGFWIFVLPVLILFLVSFFIHEKRNSKIASSIILGITLLLLLDETRIVIVSGDFGDWDTLLHHLAMFFITIVSTIYYVILIFLSKKFTTLQSVLLTFAALFIGFITIVIALPS